MLFPLKLDPSKADVHILHLLSSDGGVAPCTTFHIAQCYCSIDGMHCQIIYHIKKWASCIHMVGLPPAASDNDEASKATAASCKSLGRVPSMHSMAHLRGPEFQVQFTILGRNHWAALSLSLERHCERNAADVDPPAVAGGGGAPELSVLLRQRALIWGRHPQPHQVPPPIQLLQSHIVHPANHCFLIACFCSAGSGRGHI